jgi:putative ABC transport system substrate-binding protein
LAAGGARAQLSKKTPRVGVLWHAGSAEEEAIYYIDGKTISLEHHFPNEIPERFIELGAELAALKPDVLVAVTRPAAMAAQRATTTCRPSCQSSVEVN